MTTVKAPPAGWRIAGWAFIAMAGICAATLAVRLAAWAVVLSDSRTSATNRGGLIELTFVASRLATLAVLVAYAVWFYACRRFARRHGADGDRAVRHWTLTLWRVAFILSIVPAYLLPGVTTAQLDEASTADLLAMVPSQVGFAIRLISLVFLVPGIVIVHRRMHDLASGTYQPATPTPAQVYWSRRPPENPFEEHWTDYRNPVP